MEIILQNVKVRVTLYDYDKNTKVSEIGSANIALKTLKSALIDTEDEDAIEVSLGAKITPKLVSSIFNSRCNM